MIDEENGIIDYALIENIGLENISIVTNFTDGTTIVGAIVGQFTMAHISKSFVTGNITSSTSNNQTGIYMGGICGFAYYCQITNSFSRINCYASENSDVSECAYELGGIAGYAYYLTVENCYSSGEVALDMPISATSTSHVRGFIASSAYSTLTNCFWDIENSGNTEGLYFLAGNNSGLTGKTTAEMKIASTYTNWDFTDIWAIDVSETINSGYPFLYMYPLCIWTGTTSNNWMEASNWNSNSIPTSEHQVYIPNNTCNNPVLSREDKSEIRSLIIGNTASLTLESGYDATSGEIHTASLIINEPTTSKMRVQSYLSGGKYHYIGSPLIYSDEAGRHLSDIETTEDGSSDMGLNLNENNDNLWRWNETFAPSGDWDDILHGADGSNSNSLMGTTYMEAGRGYAYGNNDTKTLIYEGVPNCENVSYSVTYNATTGHGYHVVSNPFTASIAINSDADATNNFLNDNAAILNDNYEAIYIWDECENWTNTDCYKVISNSGFDPEYATSTGQFSKDFASTGQGFMIRVNYSGNLVFNKAIQKNSASEFCKSAKSHWPGVQLIATAEHSKTSTSIGFNSNMTAGLDPSYDVASMMSNETANIYSEIEGNENPFAVQSLPIKAEYASCGIDVIEAGEYSFSIYQDQMQSVVLEDTQTGTLTNMITNSNYTVYLGEGDHSSRFILHFKAASEVLQLTEEQGTIYTNNHNIYIENISGLVEIYDINGRLVKCLEANGGTQQIPMQNVASGVYIVKSASNNSKVVL